jgi:hypothetical protein
MVQEGLSWETARLLVKKADHEITAAIRQLYGKKWEDTGAYEIRFDTSAQDGDYIVESIKSLLTAKDHLKTPEALERLERQALAAGSRP